jgi:hypothetical protein
MRRIHWVELCDGPLPPNLRREVMSSLAWLQERSGTTDAIARAIPVAAHALGATAIVELGSGAGELMAQLARVCPYSVDLVASDLHPPVELWERRFGRRIAWLSEPVSIASFDDAIAAAKPGNVALLLSAALHHLDDDAARAFFERAARARVHVIVAEPVRRSFLGVALGAATGLGALALPLSEPRRLATLAWHWLFPVVPALLSHDGIVSALRQRDDADWARLTRDLPFTRHTSRPPALLDNVTLTSFRHAEVGQSSRRQPSWARVGPS